MIRVFQHYISARKLALVLSETALLFLIFALGSSMRIAPFEIRTEEIYDARFTALLAAIVCQITLGFQDLYEWRISAQRRERYPRIVAACGISFVVLAAIFFYFQVATESLGFGVAAEDIRIRTWRFIATVVCAFIGIAVFRAFFHGIVGKWGLEERILILGSGELALSLAREISDHRDCGFEIAGMLPGPTRRRSTCGGAIPTFRSWSGRRASSTTSRASCGSSGSSWRFRIAARRCRSSNCYVAV